LRFNGLYAVRAVPSYSGDTNCGIPHHKERKKDMKLKQAKAEFLSGYFSTHRRTEKTRTAYSSDLNQFASFAGPTRTLESLSGSVVEEWAAHLRNQKYAPASMRRKIAALKVFCAYWVRKGTMLQSPFWRVKLSFGRVEQLPRTLTVNETRALLAEARKIYVAAALSMETTGPEDCNGRPRRSYRTLRNSALVDLLFATGVRVGEVATLDLADYLVKESVFKVHGKGGRDRLAFAVDKSTRRIQQTHVTARMRIASTTSALFLNASGKRLSTQGIAAVISSLCKNAGIERRVTPHMLRHTVATLLLRNGADVRVVQEFLGHSSIATTQRYTHISKDHLIGVLQKRHPSLGLRAAV
jgi:integrase/recombinase XerD